MASSRVRASSAALAVALLVCAACTKKEPRGPGRIVALDTRVEGLSGLTRDEHGALWAPGENADAVLRIDPDTLAVTRYPVVGAPEGVDLEAIAWVEGTRFIVGTESQESGRAQDVILDGRLEGNRFRVAPIGQLDYARWQMAATDNHGIEGICFAEGVLVVAAELAQTRDGRRWAPLGVFEPNTQSWTAHRVALTSDSGKLAALDCRAVDGVIHALAVERHFGVSRLLRFQIPLGPEGQQIEPRVAIDLAEHVSPIVNFEGLAWLDDGSAFLLTDNRYRGRAPDPSRLYSIPASLVR